MSFNLNLNFIEQLASMNFQILDRYSQVAVLVDENTKQYCYPLLKSYLKNAYLIEIESGEINKNLKTCHQIWQALTNYNFDRHSLVLNLGGGVIGDMGGFCAATYKRGIEFIQVPTTLLAQVDASVGGKLGIDFEGFKNHIGIFQEPLQVWIYPPFLKTLPKRELLSGLAEIIKHSLIADKNQWEKLANQNVEQYDWASFIPQSVAIKSSIVEQDPRETLGIRQALNFGHTVGHAVERFFLGHPKRHLLHGEAVVVGLICEVFLSQQRGLLSEQELKCIHAYLHKIYGKVNILESELNLILENVLQDKKNKNRVIKCVLLKGIGNFKTEVEVSAAEVKQSLEYYINYAR